MKKLVFGISVFVFLLFIYPFVIANDVTYKDAVWRCYDGFVESESNTSCKTTDVWRERAEERCSGRCSSKNISMCGVDKFAVALNCSYVPMKEEWRKKADFRCYDGFENNLGESTSCKSIEVWRENAENICKNRCNSDKSKCGVDSFGVSETCSTEDFKYVCTDSDGGKNYEKKGKTCIGENCNKDYCDVNQGNSFYNLIEHYCESDTNTGSTTYNCLYGCNDGVCIQSNSTCTLKTCSQLGKQCGNWDNGCGQSVYCGICPRYDNASEITAEVKKFSEEIQSLTKKDFTEEEVITKYNEIYEDGFVCMKQCPEDNKGDITESCWRKCNKIGEDKFLWIVFNEEIISKYPTIAQKLENNVNQKNKEASECLKKCGNPYPKADYECIQSCFTEKVSEENSCSGCLSDDKCFSFGYRMDKKFCSQNGEFTTQFNKEESCENNFECSSNVCVSGKCVNSTLLEKILNWFRRLFGKE
ncbi:MAG: hypothetical protein AABX16_00560 [Nanoarchaeota archaeon]